MLKYAENRTILVFHKYILNMHGYIAYYENTCFKKTKKNLTCLKIAIHVFKTHSVGSMSQNFDIGLSFNLIAFRMGDFPKLKIKSRKVTRFLP